MRGFWLDIRETVMKISLANRCPYDSSKFVYIDPIDDFRKLLLNCHVDDLTKVSTWPAKTAELNFALTTRYGKPKLYDPMTDYLGMQFIYQDNGAITVHMSNHITAMVTDFNLQVGNQPNAPRQPSSLTVLKRDPSSPPFNVKMYQKGSGKILYPAVQIRSDILLASKNACKYNHNPTIQDAQNLQQVAEYLASTHDLGPTFYTTGGAVLKAKCDTGFAVDPITGQSRTALSLHIGSFDNAACIAKTWNLTILTNSASIAEFIGMSDVARVIVEARNVLDWCGFPQTEPTSIAFLPNGDPQHINLPTELQSDCSSAITMVKSEDMTKGTKHLLAREQYIRQEYELGTIDPIKVSTKDFSIDFMTKACVGEDFKSKRNQHFNVKANPDFKKYL